MSTVHLICGSTGAGKTTYAIALSQRIKGIRFSIDEWIGTLFLPDRPTPSTLEWAVERMDRCERHMWTIADQLIARSVDIVFDWGLSTFAQRDHFRTRIAQTSAESKLHYLDVSQETRRARILSRLKTDPKNRLFEVTEAMFDAMEGLFEPPSDDELYGAMIVCED
jgi:predicted kinase